MLRISAQHKMDRMHSGNTFVLCCVLIALTHLVLILVMGTQKQGFFIDEYFTHTLSNSPNWMNLRIENHAWNDPGQILRQLTVVPNNPNAAFNYSRVIENTAADVHPPLYYLLFHTLCSLAPGLFSKWLGIFLNIPFSLGCLALVGLLAWQLTHSRALALLVAGVYASNPGALSNALFIRMYCMLSFFVLLAIWLHVLVQNKVLSFGKFLPCIAATYFCGFMTQYYFILFAGFLSAACFLIWLFCGHWKQALLYAGTLVAALAAAYLFYPAWVSHLFNGYRGIGAVVNLVNNNTLFKLSAFAGELNTVLFAYCLPLLVAGLFAAAAVCIWQRRACGVAGVVRACVRTHARRQALLLGLLCLISFCFIAKISNVTERNFSIRYLFLLFAPLLLLLVLGAVWLLCRANARRAASVICVGLLFTCINIFGLVNGNSVEYLFSWDRQLIKNAQDNHDTPVVLMHTNTLFIGMTNQLLQYDQYFPIWQTNPQRLPDDERLTKATRVLLYMQKRDDPLAKENIAPLEEYLPYLRKNFPQLPNIREMPSPVYHYQLFELST